MDIGSILPVQESEMKHGGHLITASLENAGTAPLSVNEVHPLDELRTQKVLESMRLLKYEGLVPSEVDMNFGEDFVSDTLARQTFPLLASNIEALAGNVQPVLMRTVGDKKVAMLGLSSLPLQDTNVLDRLLPEIQQQADFIVILSNLSREMNRTIAENYQNVSAILSYETGETETIGNVLITYSGSNGETLGALLLNTDDALGVSAQQIALTEEVEESDLPHGVRDFNTIKEKLYDTAAYPSQEHLYYRNFEPALERLRFISKQLKRLDEGDMQFCDLGFGPGVLTQFILQEKPKWHGWGIDISPECVRYANKLMEFKGINERVQFTTGDVRQLPYTDNNFDLILAMEVLEHIPDPLKGLLEAVRVLKPGGYAITSIPVQLPIPMHLYVPKSPREVLDLYESADLEVLDFSAKEFKIETGSFVATFALSIKA